MYKGTPTHRSAMLGVKREDTACALLRKARECKNQHSQDGDSHPPPCRRKKGLYKRTKRLDPIDMKIPGVRETGVQKKTSPFGEGKP